MRESRFAWLASYPRSGNTWVRLLLSSLLRPNSPLDINAMSVEFAVANRQEFDELLGVESSELSEVEIEAARPALHAAILAEGAEGPLVFRKVHDRFRYTLNGESIFPAALSRGAIYLVRDPRDIALSLSAFKGLPIDAVIDFMQDHRATLASDPDIPHFQLPQPLGTWSEHVESWLDRADVAVHLLRFEDLLDDPAGRLADVAVFWGLPANRATGAARIASFSTLQEQEKRRGFCENLHNRKELFFRKGKAGQWRTHLRRDRRARIEAAHGKVMRRLGYL